MISNRIVQKNNVAGGPTTNLWGWGRNTLNMIKTSAGSDISSPIMTDKVGSSNNWLMVSNGSRFACGIDESFYLWCWGRNNYGQLGNGTTSDSSSPVQVGNNTWAKVSCGTDHVLAIERTSNKLYAWGRNDFGQLGDNTTNNKSTPTQIGNLAWLTISAGNKFSAAIINYNTYNGDLFTWGKNNRGQLGDYTTTNRSSPVMVTYGSYPTYIWNNVVCGYEHTLATARDNYVNTGRFFSWGFNNYGQLGNGSTTDTSSPIMNLVPSGNNLIQIEAGGQSSAFIDTVYNLYCFGQNTYGQLGNNNIDHQYNPIGILTDAKYIEMGAKTSSKVTTFLIKNDNSLWSWGYGDSSGILGNGNISSISSPVQIGTDWSKLSITGGINNGSFHDMFALKS